MPATPQQLRSYARKMRAHPTKSEAAALQILSTLKVKVLNQVIFGHYIIDFVIPSLLLAIEIDGSSHIGKEAYDLARDIFIRSNGLSILHIKNEDLHTLIPSINNLNQASYHSRIYKQLIKKVNIHMCGKANLVRRRKRA